MCGLKNMAESEVILKPRTCGTVGSLEPLIVTGRSGGVGVGWDGVKIIILIFSVFSFENGGGGGGGV